jgi:hypothetical protein
MDYLNNRIADSIPSQGVGLSSHLSVLSYAASDCEIGPIPPPTPDKLAYILQGVVSTPNRKHEIKTSTLLTKRTEKKPINNKMII